MSTPNFGLQLERQCKAHKQWGIYLSLHLDEQARIDTLTLTQRFLPFLSQEEMCNLICNGTLNVFFPNKTACEEAYKQIPRLDYQTNSYLFAMSANDLGQGVSENC